MEVKPGYKQTEVGVIPQDWRVSAIESLVDEISMGPFGSDITVSNFVSYGIPVLNGSNVAQERLYDYFENFVTPAKARTLKKAIARRGDVVVTHRGTIGQIAYIPEDSVYEKYVVSQSQFRVRFSRKILPSWVVSYFHSESGSKKLLEGKGHTGVPAIAQPTRTFRTLLLPVPPLPEQREIATALSDMDALLDGLDRLIAKKRAIKQAVMQQLLTGQTRLSGFSGEWEVKRLGDLADIRSGGTPCTGDAAAWDGAVPWCTPTDITALEGRKYLTTTNRAITEHGLSTSSAELIPARSIVMTSRATIGECAINAVPVTTNQGFKNLVPHDSVDVEFLYYLLSTQTQGLIGISAGSTFLEIGKTQLRQYEVKLPAEKDEQTAIATVLSDMDAEITALETRRAKTRALKQAMMQELLTGRTRLVMPDAKPVGEVAAQTEGRKANVHFLRSVLAAEIIDQLHDQPTFGHVKFEKMMFLAEHLCQVDTGSTYHRKAAGPYDNRALRSIDSQLQKQQWFEARKQDGRYQYVPLAKRGGHKPYFERHFSGIAENLEKILGTFKTAKTEQCEIVATLLAAWSDLLREKGAVSDEMIVHEVLHNWHEAKQRIPEDRWLMALGWMREKGFVPKGVTLP